MALRLGGLRGARAVRLGLLVPLLGRELRSCRAWTLQNEANVESAGAGHRLSLSAGGVVYASGSNSYGQLGDGTTTDRSSPVLVQAGVQSVAVGAFHSLFLRHDGEVHAAGWNAWGQLGDRCTCGPASPECRACLWDRPFQASPALVQVGVLAVAAGAAHSVFLARDGTASAVGWNARGQLGDGTLTSRRHAVQVMTGVRSVAAGASHSLFLMNDTNGTVYATGANSNGQLGDGTATDRSVPVLVRTGVRSVVAGVAQTLFLMMDGTVQATD